METSRVLMTTDTVGGVWTYCIELARELGELGVEVALAAMGAPPSPEQRAEVAALTGVELHHAELRLEWMNADEKELRAAGDWLGGLERELAPDVVHLNQYCHGARPWSAAVVITAHSCVLSWWRAVKRTPAPAEWRAYFERVRAGLHAADLVVAPTRALLREIDAIYGPLGGARVISNARRHDLFPRRGKDEFVLSAGRLWDEAKNLETLARAAERLSWPVVVAGDNRHPSGREITFPGVHHLGRLEQPQLAQWMGRAAIYALPARYEPFGLSALEAALAGCALVLGDIPTLRELWHGAALFVEPDDDVALAAALESLAGDRAARERLAARARARALSFDPAGMAGEYLEAYTAARAPRRRPPLLEASSWEEYTRATEPAPRIASLAG